MKTKTRECIYCKDFYGCEGRPKGVDYCNRFIPDDEVAEKRYKQWRSKLANNELHRETNEEMRL